MSRAKHAYGRARIVRHDPPPRLRRGRALVGHGCGEEAISASPQSGGSARRAGRIRRCSRGRDFAGALRAGDAGCSDLGRVGDNARARSVRRGRRSRCCWRPVSGFCSSWLLRMWRAQLEAHADITASPSHDNHCSHAAAAELAAPGSRADGLLHGGGRGRARARTDTDRRSAAGRGGCSTSARPVDASAVVVDAAVPEPTAAQPVVSASDPAPAPGTACRVPRSRPEDVSRSCSGSGARSLDDLAGGGAPVNLDSLRQAGVGGYAVITGSVEGLGGGSIPDWMVSEWRSNRQQGQQLYPGSTPRRRPRRSLISSITVSGQPLRAASRTSRVARARPDKSGLALDLENYGVSGGPW